MQVIDEYKKSAQHTSKLRCKSGQQRQFFVHITEKNTKHDKIRSVSK